MHVYFNTALSESVFWSYVKFMRKKSEGVFRNPEVIKSKLINS